jgi:hypothetical protein
MLVAALCSCSGESLDEPTPAKSATPPAAETPPHTPPSITLTEERYPHPDAKKHARRVLLERSAVEKVIAWCGRDGTIPFWRGNMNVDATYVDDRKANLVNVTVDPDHRDDTLFYAVRFKAEKPVAITATKESAALACRDLERDVESPIE